MENPQNFGYQIVFRPVEVHHFLRSRLQQHLTVFFSYFPEKSNPYFVILGPRILFQIYPFLSEIMDERGVIFSLTLHPPGSRVNKLSPNPKKTKCLVIGHPLMTRNLDFPWVLTLDGSGIKKIGQAKSLDIIIGEKLTWD